MPFESVCGVCVRARISCRFLCEVSCRESKWEKVGWQVRLSASSQTTQDCIMSLASHHTRLAVSCRVAPPAPSLHHLTTVVPSLCRAFRSLPVKAKSSKSLSESSPSSPSASLSRSRQPSSHSPQRASPSGTFARNASGRPALVGHLACTMHSVALPQLIRPPRPSLGTCICLIQRLRSSRSLLDPPAVLIEASGALSLLCRTCFAPRL